MLTYGSQTGALGLKLLSGHCDWWCRAGRVVVSSWRSWAQRKERKFWRGFVGRAKFRPVGVSTASARWGAGAWWQLQLGLAYITGVGAKGPAGAGCVGSLSANWRCALDTFNPPSRQSKPKSSGDQLSAQHHRLADDNLMPRTNMPWTRSSARPYGTFFRLK